MTNSFIKWAGGKRQLLSQIESILPDSIYNSDKFNYIEPFIGGGSMLFFIIDKFQNKLNKIIINDINPKLINVYKVIKTDVNLLIKGLEDIRNEYILSNDKRKTYLDVRFKFNNCGSLSDLELAIYFIFLNKTCFNGLYRTNKSGMFNVPFGKQENPVIFNKDNLLKISQYLQMVDILNVSYNEIDLSPIGNETNLFYFDPPYKPISEKSNFNYFSVSFDDNEQIKLKEYIDSINQKNNLIMLSNSSHPVFNELYKNYNMHVLYAKRSINSDKNNRGKIKEILVTNY